MKTEPVNPMISRTVEVFNQEFGAIDRDTAKVAAWKVRPDLGVVVEVDTPRQGQIANVWVPYPPEGQTVPEIALEYPGEAGRHSNTYASPGLSKGLPALKLRIKTEAELRDTVSYIKAMRESMPLPEVKAEATEPTVPVPVDATRLPRVEERPVARREAIPRAVQREVWQRDGGRCVECGTKEKLCFDHIVPFSRGGSNTIRNLQLLCERCNLSKGNRI